jgi:anti-sigma B factor antagonist
MGTSLKEEVHEDVIVLSVEGNLVAGPDVVVLHECIKKWVADGIVRVVVDFSQVSWFGSSMLGVLAASYTTFQNAGGGVRLIGVSEKVAQIMAVTRLSDVFETLPTLPTLPTLEDALSSLRARESMGT